MFYDIVFAGGHPAWIIYWNLKKTSVYLISSIISCGMFFSLAYTFLSKSSNHRKTIKTRNSRHPEMLLFAKARFPHTCNCSYVSVPTSPKFFWGTLCSSPSCDIPQPMKSTKIHRVARSCKFLLRFCQTNIVDNDGILCFSILELFSLETNRNY